MTRAPFIVRTGIRIGSSLLTAGLLLAAVGSSQAQEIKAGTLTIEHTWARATPPGAKVGGGYLTIENTGGEADTLISATAKIAGHVEMHEMAVVDGVMKMRPLAGGVEIPAGASVEFKPGSYHLMLMDLAHPLSEGETFTGTLTFEKAGTVDVTYEIGPIGGSMVPEHDHGSMMMEEGDDAMGN